MDRWECTAVHGRVILFTWELKESSKSRRWFYANLRRLLDELPRNSWCKLGGSVYLVEKRYSVRFLMLLKKFEGPELTWYSFEIVRQV
ncbi:MAG: hypothetical protein QXX33_01580 [Candidatus Hadarchaeales archaeon]